MSHHPKIATKQWINVDPSGKYCVMVYSHCTGTGPGQVQGMGTWFIYCTERFTLFPIMLVQFPVPVPAPLPCSVNKSQDWKSCQFEVPVHCWISNKLLKQNFLNRSFNPICFVTSTPFLRYPVVNGRWGPGKSWNTNSEVMNFTYNVKQVKLLSDS